MNIKIKCAHCGKVAEKEVSHVNRSLALGLRLFCGRRCSGLGRRKPPKSKAQRRAEKAAYDKIYRQKNLAKIKARKRARHLRTYDPEKARIERKKRAPAHAEYCRRPEYKRWKSEYDRQYRAKEFGPFAEAYRLTIELNREIKGRMTNEQIQRENGTQNKTQRRRRETSEEVQRSRPRHRDRRDRHQAAHG